MNVEDPNDPKFDTIRRALALKRHETPPPRYFNELPGRIRARLAEADASEPVSFLEKLRQAFVLRPMMATGAGMVAGVFVLGVAAMALLPAGNDGLENSVTLTPVPTYEPAAQPGESPSPTGLAGIQQNGTNSPAEQPPSLFDSFKIETAPASSRQTPR